MENTNQTTNLVSSATTLKTSPFSSMPSLKELSSSKSDTGTTSAPLNPTIGSPTVTQSSKSAQGWVDKAKILTKEEFIQRLKDNL